MHFSATGSNSYDLDLSRRIRNYLSGQHVSDLRRVAVDADRGVITLRGRVHTYHYKQLCLHCCQRVAGVIRVDDQISVGP